MKPSKCWLVALSVLMCACGPGAAAEDPPAEKPKPIQYAKPRPLCKLANRAVSESSGIACSRRAKDVFWTHNDSGDRPRIYAFNTKGEDLGTFTVAGARARDWEDMASFRLGKKCYLLLADVGDNGASRPSCTLYIVEEPILGKKPAKKGIGRATLVRTIEFKYDDGPRDCESVAVDPKTRIIFLVSKIKGLQCKVYALPIPKRGNKETLVARTVATVIVPMATAMDLSPDGGRCVVLTYGPALEFTRKPGQRWNKGFCEKPRQINMPSRRQGESICYGSDGKTLYLTSEGRPAPLWEVPAVEPK